MSWKPRNQNNVVPIKVGIENKKKTDAEIRLRALINSIDFKMQQPMWDMLAFDDEELQLIANFGETIKFAHEETAPRVASVLAAYVLKKDAEEELFT